MTVWSLAPIRRTLESCSDRLVKAAVAEGGVLHDVHVHRRRGDTGHRAHAAVLVARGEGDLARGSDAVGILEVLGQALEDQRAGDGTLHRAGHVLERRRRTGVQDRRPRHAGHDVDRLVEADEHRLRGDDALDGLGVGGLDLRGDLGALEHVEGSEHLGLAAPGRGPLEGA